MQPSLHARRRNAQVLYAYVGMDHMLPPHFTCARRVSLSLTSWCAHAWSASNNGSPLKTSAAPGAAAADWEPSSPASSLAFCSSCVNDRPTSTLSSATTGQYFRQSEKRVDKPLRAYFQLSNCCTEHLMRAHVLCAVDASSEI